MNFVVATLDGSRVLCQFADMTLVQWIDARVAEAIGYSYAIRFETRHGADRCAFMNNGAVVALGDWDDTEANRISDGRRVDLYKRPRRPGKLVRGQHARQRIGVAYDDRTRGGPAPGVRTEAAPHRCGERTDGRRAGTVIAQLASAVTADWRARQSDARLADAYEWEELMREGWG